jgi:exonuclease VII small subunit
MKTHRAKRPVSQEAESLAEKNERKKGEVRRLQEIVERLEGDIEEDEALDLLEQAVEKAEGFVAESEKGES